MRHEESSAWLTLWKKTNEYKFLTEAPSQVLQQKLMDLNKAFRDCFDKKQTNKRMPRWRKKNVHDSIRFPKKRSIRIDNHSVYSPKIGRIRYYNSRDIEGEIRNATISKEGKYWYISI